LSVDIRSLPGSSSRAIPSVLVDVLLILGVGAIVAVSRQYLDFHAGIPGSSGLFWIGLLVGGRLIVKRDGAGVAMGVSSALWALPIGSDATFGHNLVLFALAGGSLDLLYRLPFLHMEHPVGAAISGAVAHLAKFGFITYTGLSMGLYRHFLEVGLFTSAGNHILFGAISACAAAIAIGTARHVIKTKRQRGRTG
jgi:hypothetical protein